MLALAADKEVGRLVIQLVRPWMRLCTECGVVRFVERPELSVLVIRRASGPELFLQPSWSADR